MDDDIKKNIPKMGTITVGVVCKDCIVLGADQRVTGEMFIVHKRAKKLFKLIDNIAITTAGQPVSDVQFVLKLTRAELKLKTIRTKALPDVKEAANLFASIIYQNIRKLSLLIAITHFIVGGKDSTGFHLYEASPDGSVLEHEDYVTAGAYGSIMGYGILENEWKQGLTVEEGKKLVLKVLSTSVKRDASTGEPFNVAVIDDRGVGEIEEVKISPEEKKGKVKK